MAKQCLEDPEVTKGEGVSDRGPVLWFVGLTTLDIVHRGVVPPTRNQKLTATWQGVSAGGPAANAAVVAARLGARAVLITAIGEGPLADVVRRDLASQEVEVLDLGSTPSSCAERSGVAGSREGVDFSLAVSAILVDEETGERSVVSPDGGRWTGPQAGAFDNAIRDYEMPDAILFDGHHPGIVHQIIKWLNNKPKMPKIILDGGRWKPIFSELLPIADVAALSSDFLIPVEALRDTAISSSDEPQDDGVGVLNRALKMGAKAVAITNGPDPVKWATSYNEYGESKVPKVKAVDTLGAGDAFHGALTYAIAKEDNLPKAIEFANKVASMRVQYRGNRDWLENIAALQRISGSEC